MRSFGWAGAALAVAIVVATAACARVVPGTFEPGTERMPASAEIWLTAVPATPGVAVPVTMTSQDDPDLLFSHTFAPDRILRGDFATSEGRYRLSALGGACILDLTLRPGLMAEVVLTIDDAGCTLAIARVGRIDDPAMSKEEPAVLITNHGVGDATPFEEPRARR